MLPGIWLHVLSSVQTVGLMRLQPWAAPPSLSPVLSPVVTAPADASAKAATGKIIFTKFFMILNLKIRSTLLQVFDHALLYRPV